MASLALEEKINKIRLRNEEIKRRYEEVEADKKNAAKLDALSEPIPSEDWPERKEPPEFSGTSAKQTNKQKHSVRKYNDQTTQYYTGSGEGKKSQGFAEGQGPPPDPKYNFLADSEREERANEIPKESERNRGRNKNSRGGFKRRGSGRDWRGKDQWNQYENPGNMTHPEYEAWRAERNRIDEARINRQRTAEGNWRREWDNDKINLGSDVAKRDNRVTTNDVVTRQEYNENEKYYRSPRNTTSVKNSHQMNGRESHHQLSNFLDPVKNHGGAADNDKRLVIATDKSIKVVVNTQGSTPSRSSVMSVKVNSPNIAGTGRVGPRQRPRVTYSSQSEPETPLNENALTMCQKSLDDSPRIRNLEQTNKMLSPKSPRGLKKNEGKMTFPIRKDNEEGIVRSRKFFENIEGTSKSKKDLQKSSRVQKRGPNYPPKSPGSRRKSAESSTEDSSKSFKHLEKEITENNLPEKVTESFDLQFKVNSSIDEAKLKESVDKIEIGEEKNENVIFQNEAITKCFKNSEDSLIPIGLESEEASCSMNEKCLEFVENIPMDVSTNNENEKAMESSEDRPMNRSDDNELTGNDSGFIELSLEATPDKKKIESKKIEGNSMESDNRFKENDLNIIIPEKKSSDENNEKISDENSTAEIAKEIVENSGNTIEATGNGETIELKSCEKDEKNTETIENQNISMNLEDVEKNENDSVIAEMINLSVPETENSASKLST